MEKIKILFVCMGNICRSPAAEAVMKTLIDKRGLGNRFEIDSAGTIGYHEGEPADSRMKKHAFKRGIDITSISRKVRPEQDFHYFDMIIGMDDANMADLVKVAPDVESRSKLYKMTNFCVNHKAQSVPDPYYGGSDGFELVLDLLDDACIGLLKHLKYG
jgi:protein-tyrosine phosphatase